MTEDLEILQGAISAVVYQNYENGYAVLRLNVGGGQNVTVVGTIPLPAVGERLMVTGKWSTHSSYGRQFEAEFLERLMPQTSLEILNYLSSRIIKGIGPKTAARIVEHFGEQTLLVMEREPERLAEVPGIPGKSKAMGEEFRLQVGMRQLMEFLPCITSRQSWRCGRISCTATAPWSCFMTTRTYSWTRDWTRPLGRWTASPLSWAWRGTTPGGWRPESCLN